MESGRTEEPTCSWITFKKKSRTGSCREQQLVDRFVRLNDLSPKPLDDPANLRKQPPMVKRFGSLTSGRPAQNAEIGVKTNQRWRLDSLMSLRLSTAIPALGGCT